MGGVECCFLRAPAAPLLASAGCLLGLPSGVYELPFLWAWSVLLSGTASTMSCKGRPMQFNPLPAGSKAQRQGLGRQHALLRLIAFQCCCAVHGVNGLCSLSRCSTACCNASGGNHTVMPKLTLKSRPPKLHQTFHAVQPPCHTQHDIAMAHERPPVPPRIEVGHYQRHVRQPHLDSLHRLVHTGARKARALPGQPLLPLGRLAIRCPARLPLRAATAHRGSLRGGLGSAACLLGAPRPWRCPIVCTASPGRQGGCWGCGSALRALLLCSCCFSVRLCRARGLPQVRVSRGPLAIAGGSYLWQRRYRCRQPSEALATRLLCFRLWSAAPSVWLRGRKASCSALAASCDDWAGHGCTSGHGCCSMCRRGCASSIAAWQRRRQRRGWRRLCVLCLHCLRGSGPVEQHHVDGAGRRAVMVQKGTRCGCLRPWRRGPGLALPLQHGVTSLSSPMVSWMSALQAWIPLDPLAMIYGCNAVCQVAKEPGPR